MPLAEQGEVADLADADQSLLRVHRPARAAAEIGFVSPSEETLKLRDLLRARVGDVNAPALPDNGPQIEEFLQRYWYEGTFRRILYVQEQMQAGKLSDPYQYYSEVAECKAYYALGLTPETVRVVCDFADMRELLLAHITDVGSANSDILRMLKMMRREVGNELLLRRRVGNDLEKFAVRNEPIAVEILQDYFYSLIKNPSLSHPDFNTYTDHALTAIDFTQAFPNWMRNEAGLNGVRADMCWPADRLFGLRDDQRVPLLMPHSQDLFIISLILDRVKSFEQMIENIKIMANPGAKFVIVLVVPFSNKSDAMAGGEPIVFWEKAGDPRESWIVKEDGEWSAEDCAKALQEVVTTLASRGLIVKNIGVQPNVVCNPHALITDAGTI